jgi:glyoxylase-like metal-dependent hydrolase (beta-lactamase superfamily II)
LTLAAVPGPIASSVAAQEAGGVEIVHVAENVYVLFGTGGNIAVSVGDDGAFMVDDQLAPLTDAILAAIGTISSERVRFLVNTHFHLDHTGGNENLGRGGVVIVAHENVRKRLKVESFIETFNMRSPPAPEAALPVITFGDAVTFHWNGDEIRIAYVEAAHTDGDVLIHFTEANVIHAGDIYPFIDVPHGGTLDGTIAAADRLLAMADEDTKIIPGHGPLGDAAAVEDYRRMLVTVRDRLSRLMAEGRSRDEVVAETPSGAAVRSLRTSSWVSRTMGWPAPAPATEKTDAHRLGCGSARKQEDLRPASEPQSLAPANDIVKSSASHRKEPETESSLPSDVPYSAGSPDVESHSVLQSHCRMTEPSSSTVPSHRKRGPAEHPIAQVVHFRGTAHRNRQ